MEFDAVLAQVLDLLQRDGRVSYRALKLRFHLNDEYIEALKDEIIEVKRQAIDRDGRVLVWIGDPGTAPEPGAAPPAPVHVAAEDRPRQLPTAQAGPTPQAASLAVGGSTAAAERRQLTVMFCDLADSTSLARQLDPEDYREVIRAYQAACAEVIQRFDGYIAQYLGDGLLVYYGYPQAHEDDAQRAIRTGLGIIEAIGMLNTRLEHEWSVRLTVRVGIHTGLVVVGEMGSGDRRERLALGETPNIAAKLQGLAAPETVVISALTYRLTQGYFVCQDLGPHTIRPNTAPLYVYRVIEEREAQSRWDIAVQAGLTPMVGRQEEISLLRRRWEQSKAGSGQVVLLRGESGIGKSRLVEALRAQVQSEGYRWLTFRCSPYHTHSAFYPVIDALERLLPWSRDMSPEAKFAHLEQALQRYRSPLQEAVPLFAALLSLPLPAERYHPLSLSLQRQKQRTQEMLVAYLLEETRRRPVLVVWEDLHWADPSTLELLSLVINQAPMAPMLIMMTFRPELRPPEVAHSHLTQITLGRLGRHQVEQIVAHLTHGKTLPAEILEQVIAKTDGVPLFVEELIKMVLESGLVHEAEDHYVLTGQLPPLAIPATLQDSLMARLDRLGTARQVAQLGATLGREFTYEVIQAVAPLDEVVLQHELAQLVAAELVYQRGLPPQARYLFKHPLIQETAYQSLLKSTRQRYHQRIAQVLGEQFPEIVKMQPELLAHHYTEAGLPDQAVSYWLQAGQLAIERSANLEAISHLTKGLEVLKTLPDTPERAQHELSLQLALGSPLGIIKGYTAAEVEHVYTRAQELCQQVGESPQLFSALMGLWRFSLNRPRLRTARELGEQCFSLAQHLEDSVRLQEAHAMLGSTLLYLGEPVSALAHLEQGIALYDPQRYRSLTFSRGLDPGVVCLSRAAWALWLLGYPDQALTRVQAALTLAEESSHAYSLAFALHYAAMLHLYRREAHVAQERAEAAIALSRERGIAQWLTGGMFMRGWALAEQGAVEEGIVQLQQAQAAWQALGTGLGQAHLAVRLAEAYGKGGQAEVGLQVLAQALETVHSNAEHYYEAELYRVKGELLLRQAVSGEMVRMVSTEAEACFQQALDIARRQRATSLQLRALLSLSRLWQQQGQPAAAHRMLAETYGWFTEGFDTRDLQEAKALLEALA
jgi:class 3 adenylate cyclase/predicted ATPase